ncbi:MAG: epoxyqueuosine reductase QueH [Coriobacteriia bacterium]|nr:epoxyqueuosine reductase QueH [Coriobacteriia bacterium]
MKILMHACCGPCTIEPAYLLREEGHDLSFAFFNPNIAPFEEHQKRVSELKNFCEREGFRVIEFPYEQSLWEESVAPYAHHKAKRCKACYDLRLNACAVYAKNQGFDALSTTLTVSPYQYIQSIKSSLKKAAESVGIQAIFRDFTPYYEDSVRDSRALVMYRQNYCGCRFSAVEAGFDRVRAKHERHLDKAQAYAEKSLSQLS